MKEQRRCTLLYSKEERGKIESRGKIKEKRGQRICREERGRKR